MLANLLVEKIRQTFPIDADDVKITPSGVTGPDIWLSPLAKKHFPFDVECKCQEQLNIWAALKQAEGHGPRPIVVFRRNRTKPYVALDLDLFMELVGGKNKGDEKLREHGTDKADAMLGVRKDPS